ncbi:hypothetical protein H6758_02415 [Candidatus Nomurabacteria bacterium]|nr:hypothetical protein [Candidatus Nomurabacteria bacterium]
MKKVTTLSLAILALFGVMFFAGCGKQEPLTEQQQAEQHGMTLEEYRDTKEAAARMNMNVEEHMNMDH